VTPRPATAEPLFYGVVKRMLDGLTAAVALALLAPLLGAIAVVIRARMGAPVLFRQTRPGKGGAPFVMYKFRTMTSAPPDQRRGDDRITPLGRHLRRLSLDELPQLWNVLRGDMSLVGPRPLLEAYSAWFTERERRRLAVRPGITGWAQVHGRANVPWSERLEMDAWYVDNRSFSLDVKILALTLLRVVRIEDVDPPAGPRLQHDLDVERRLEAQNHGA
jgi:lipopolysaccharide/colanic/teichoic acid biosynthesis glycosyltransferase